MYHAWETREIRAKCWIRKLERKIFKYTLKKEGWRLDFFGSGYGPVAGSWKHGDEPSVSTIGEFHEQLC
jgi:hypothetical protein